MENPDPEIASVEENTISLSFSDLKLMSNENEKVSEDEVFELLKNIKDPEHPELSLAQLRVVKKNQIAVYQNNVVVEYTPTIPTCSVAVLIGLTLLRKLQLCIPDMYHVSVQIEKGKHTQELQVNKQLADKERVAAAMENPNLGKLVSENLYKTDFMPEHLLLW